MSLDFIARIGVSPTPQRMSTPDLHKNNNDATTAPGVNDDSGDGYSVGSLWFDKTAGKIYGCTDATVGAANWEDMTVGGAGGAPAGATYIVQTPHADLSAEQPLNALGDGLLKHASGVVAKAVADTDYPSVATVAINTAHAAASAPHSGHIANTLVSAKGDIIIASAADTPARLSVGTSRDLIMGFASGLPEWRTPTEALSHEIFFAKDFASLQAAIDAASAAGGGLIYAEGKTYTENVVMNGDDKIFLQGVPGLTKIDGGASGSIALQISNSTDVVVEDFIITTATGPGGIGLNVGGTSKRINLIRVLIDECGSDGFYLNFTSGNGPVSLWDCGCTGTIDRYGIQVLATANDVGIYGGKWKDTNGACVILFSGDRGAVHARYVGTGSTRSITLSSGSNNVVCTNNFTLAAILDSGTANVVANNV